MDLLSSKIKLRIYRVNSAINYSYLINYYYEISSNPYTFAHLPTLPSFNKRVLIVFNQAFPETVLMWNHNSDKYRPYAIILNYLGEFEIDSKKRDFRFERNLHSFPYSHETQEIEERFGNSSELFYRSLDELLLQEL